MIASKDKKTKTGNPKKFLFDQNCFDEDFEEEVIVEEPPPPTFSEQELEAARKEGYERGRANGLAEAAASREKQVATLLGTIGSSFKTLFEAEALRNDQYEGEAVLVARTIFTRLFPTLNKKHGLNEVEEVINRVLQSQKDAPEIIIEVHEDFRDAVEERLGSLTGDMPANCKITVTGKADLGTGDCRMRWNNGGAARDITSLAEEINRQLEHILADKPSLQDNRVDDQTSPHQDNAAKQQDAETDDNGEN